GEFGRFLLVSPIWFDSSVAGIFGTLTNAGTLLIATRDMLQDPARLNQYIQRGQVDTLLCVPSLYQQLLSYSATLADESRLGRVIVAGEPCPPTLVQESKRKRPQVVLFNEYGPTEGTVWASTYQIETTDHPSVPIGRPIANARIYILDAQRQPVPLGVSGELYIAGSGVARGYWKRPELTSERFLEDPFTHEASARMYRTGDLGRWRDDGNIEFLGRNDFQVKIRGFRIELGEIEARLMEHPAVRDAAVIAREDTAGDKRLVAYYTTSDQNEAAVGNETLRAHLSVRLPEYMIPAAYVRLERLPLTGNGKLDRKALPAPGTASYVVHGCEPPVGEIEEMLAGMWAELLKLEHVGRHDNFFEVGGHSLLAVTLVERMRQSGLQVDVRALFATPTVAGLASAVDPEAHGIEVPANRILSDSKAVTPEMLPLVDLSAEEIEHVLASVPGGAGNVQDIYPLAPLQEGILFHHLMQGEADPYVLGTEMSFASRAQLDAYVGALQAVVDRHDILRTAVIWEGVREPVQVVWRKAAVPIEEVELDPAAGDPAQQLYARYDPRHYRIEVREAPLLRLYIAHDRAQERWLMMQLQHHLTIDHSTLEVMQEEIEAHLLGKADGLPRPLPFRNLVAQARLGVSREKHEAYFRALLGDVAEPTAPFGLLNVRGDGTGIEESRLEVEEDLARRVRQRARKLGVSVASLFHVAWALVLARVSGRQDVVFGTVVFGRMQGGEGADRVLGLFINTLPVRIRAGLEGVEESVRRAQLQLAELLRHEHASLALAQRS
ncbi:MAG: AMP-binding protein, partial [Acidobacteria bacterium]|nr:AMP-binding protein [Acidobacteriota bacterium]